MKSQWDCVLQNLGQWQGSFTRFSRQGECLDDIPSLLSLKGLNHNQSIHLVLQRFYPAQPGAPEVQPHQLEQHFSSLGPGALFFDSGAFSEGSIYFSAGSQFGVEFCLLQEPRRLRLVQIFNSDNQSGNQLDRLTLIREKRPEIESPESPALQLQDLLGAWRGSAITLYPNSPSPEYSVTSFQLLQDTENRYIQRSSLHAEAPHCTATVTVDRAILSFEQEMQYYQTLLLPNGASATAPVQILPGHAFYLELGWLLQPGLRQRLVRHYNADGKWDQLIWITEHWIAPTIAQNP